MTIESNNKKITDVDLKLKITQLFSKIKPENRSKFLEKMRNYDELSKIISVDELQLGGNSPNSTSSSVFSDDIFGDIDEEQIKALQEANDKFLKLQEEVLANEIIENVALPESRTIYRDDEITTELLDYFKGYGKSTIFSNDDKLKIWIDELMGLVKKTSILEEEKIISAKQIDSSFKPIVHAYTSGQHGINSDWIIPVSNEKRKVYNKGDLIDDYHFSVEDKDELILENKIIEADPKNTDPLSKYNGYDIQQERLYNLGKLYNNDDECKDSKNKSKLSNVQEVYTISETLGADKIIMDKRIIDKGVYRLENVYETKKKDSEKVISKTKKIAYGRKGITGVDDVEILEEPELCVNKFVVKPPGSKKEKRDGVLYTKSRLNINEEYKKNSDKLSKIIPFRKTGESYVIIELPANNKDPLSLNNEINSLHVDSKSIPVSNLKVDDKIVFRMTYPNTIFNTNILPENIDSIKSPIEKDVPSEVSIFAKFVGKDIPTYNSDDGNYHYKDGTFTDEPKCRIQVVPLIFNTKAITISKNEIVTIDMPRIIKRFKCDCNSIKSKDDIILFNNKEESILKALVINRSETDITLFINQVLIGSSLFINKMITMSIRDFKDAFISKTERNLMYIEKYIQTLRELNLSSTSTKNLTLVFRNNILHKYLEIEELKKTEEERNKKNLEKPEDGYTVIRANLNAILPNEIYISKTEKIYGGVEVSSSSTLRISLVDFKNAVISEIEPNENTFKILLECNESKKYTESNMKPISIYKKTKSNLIDVWGKVIVRYGDKDQDYLIQLLQSTKNNRLGDYVLIKSSDVKYELPKYVYEKDLLGDCSILKWLNGIITSDKLDTVVPSIHEFLNKITKKLRKHEIMNYSFITDLLGLALKYERHQIPSDVKDKLNYWIEWNLLGHIERNASQIWEIRTNYKKLDKIFSKELDSNKFRLTNGLVVPEYTKWIVNNDSRNYEDFIHPNQIIDLETNSKIELITYLKKKFDSNRDSFIKLNKKELKEHQEKKIVDQLSQAISEKSIYIPKERTEKIEEKLLRAIYTIPEPILRNKILKDFIETSCYLSMDSRTGTEWYYSKVDKDKTKLVCPHVYLNILGKSLEKYSKESEDGVVVCNNCGQVLNSLVFSYFEGYGEESIIREKVQIIDGREIVGTMKDTELIIKEDFIFDEKTQPNEYSIEEKMNRLINYLNPAIFDFFNTEHGRKIKEQAISEILLFMLDNNILNFNLWRTAQKMRYPNMDITERMFENYLNTRKMQLNISRIVILTEKQLPKEFQTKTSVISYLIDYLVQIKLVSEKQIKVFEDKITEDYKTFKNYPLIAELYKPEESKIISEEIKIQKEDKFKDFTKANINNSLTLDDAQTWLRYYIRNTHKGEHLIPTESTDQCGEDSNPSYTSSEKLELIDALERFIESKMEKEGNRTGVKTVVYIKSHELFNIPKVKDEEAKIIEAKLINKNLELKDEKDRKNIIEEIKENLEKYRYIDYLIDYKLDTNTNTVSLRMYDNGIDEDTRLSRRELIDYYSKKSIPELKSDYNQLKEREITIEPIKQIEDVCEISPIDISSYDKILSKIKEVLSKLLVNENIDKVMEILRNIEKEFIIDNKGNKTIKVITESDSKKEFAIKEHEKLAKIFSYFKRDYNFIVNGTNINEKKFKLANKLGLALKEDDDFSSLKTDYDYLDMFLKLDNFRNDLTGLTEKEMKLMENIDCSKLKDTDEISVLLSRNATNKFILCSNILRILLQYPYEWKALDFTRVNRLNKVDLNELDSLDAITQNNNKNLARFVVAFIKNMDTVFTREAKVMQNIQDYKRETFELVSKIDRAKKIKYADAVGLDLMREFNKVMKGKRKLDIKEISSDAPLETAKVEKLDRYNAVPDGEYGKIFTNNIEGENEDIGEGEYMERLE